MGCWWVELAFKVFVYLRHLVFAWNHAAQELGTLGTHAVLPFLHLILVFLGFKHFKFPVSKVHLLKRDIQSPCVSFSSKSIPKSVFVDYIALFPIPPTHSGSQALPQEACATLSQVSIHFVPLSAIMFLPSAPLSCLNPTYIFFLTWNLTNT